MPNSYHFEYMDENKFRVRERSIRKYNMLAYKKLNFEYYPKLKAGEFIGILVNTNLDGSLAYELELPTDELFKKVHGAIKLHYTVYKDKFVILLTNITPDGILDEGHRSELKAYKGVMISKSNPEKDIFKVNLLNLLNRGIGSTFTLISVVSVFIILMVGLILYFVLK